MDTIYRGSLATRGDRARAWADALLVDHGLLRLAWSNAGVVVPGVLYRSNQPTPGRLAREAKRLGLRCVLNLRGACGNGADALERAAAARLGLAFLDLPLRSRVAPPRDLLLALIEVLQRMPVPALVHCKSGADRAGFASAVFLLLRGASVRQAMRQLSWRHGHLRGSGAGVLGAVLAGYARDAEGRRDFADWVREEYDPAAIQAGFRAGRTSAALADRLLRRE
jgi:protein tyrosine/serine phosphatase